MESKTLDRWQRERRDLIWRDAVIRFQPCPHCGAGVAEECHSSPSWWPTTFHAARIKAAGL